MGHGHLFPAQHLRKQSLLPYCSLPHHQGKLQLLPAGSNMHHGIAVVYDFNFQTRRAPCQTYCRDLIPLRAVVDIGHIPGYLAPDAIGYFSGDHRQRLFR